MSRLTRHFAGRHAVVTGGSLGIGLATARALTRHGAGITLVARNPERLDAARAALERERSGAVVRTVALDVADREAVDRAMAAELAERPCDILVNSAGISHVAGFLDLTPDQLRENMDVNYFGALWMCRAVAPRMLERGSGAIVNVGSMASLVAFHGYAAYSPAKYALHGLSEVLRSELRPRGICVSIVLPPSTDTAMLAHEMEVAPPETRRIIDSTRVLSAERVAEALVRGVARGRFEIIPGLESRAGALLSRWAPGLGRRYLDRLARG